MSAEIRVKSADSVGESAPDTLSTAEERFFELHRGVSLPEHLRLVDVMLLPATYRWPRRAWTWVWWRLPPFKWVSRCGGRKSPYARVVGVVRPRFAVRPATTQPGTLPAELERGGDYDLPDAVDRVASSWLYRGC